MSFFEPHTELEVSEILPNCLNEFRRYSLPLCVVKNRLLTPSSKYFFNRPIFSSMLRYFSACLKLKLARYRISVFETGFSAMVRMSAIMPKEVLFTDFAGLDFGVSWEDWDFSIISPIFATSSSNAASCEEASRDVMPYESANFLASFPSVGIATKILFFTPTSRAFAKNAKSWISLTWLAEDITSATSRCFP